jgi:hypothetical protein
MLGTQMPIRIFYSWQSDVRVNRNFIRSALERAVTNLNSELQLEEADREILIDQDTQGLPGSPPIADAILAKIRTTDIFLADLTFIDDGAAGARKTPNPNVMLEYGYALHALGDAKLIGVFNEAFGSPSELPFDLAHRRWPIRFSFTDQSIDRTAQRQALAQALHGAISAIISQYEDQTAPQVIPNVPRRSGDQQRPPLGQALTEAIATVLAQYENQSVPQLTVGSPAFAHPSVESTTGNDVGRLRSADDFLCVRQGGEEIRLAEGPYLFLRLSPTIEMSELSEVEALRIAQQSLQPIQAMRGGGWNTGRHRTGAVVYWTASDAPLVALDASELFLTRELWGNEYHLLDPTRERVCELGFPYVPTGAVEEVLIDSLINYMNVANGDLGMPLPVRLRAGLVGVQNFRLAVDPQWFAFERFAGRILRNEVLLDTSVADWAADPFDLLRPLFAGIYDAAGVVRPDVRTVGRRQR